MPTPLPPHIAKDRRPHPCPPCGASPAAMPTHRSPADVDAEFVGREHLRDTVAELLESSEMISAAIAAGTLAVVGANYRLRRGARRDRHRRRPHLTPTRYATYAAIARRHATEREHTVVEQRRRRSASSTTRWARCGSPHPRSTGRRRSAPSRTSRSRDRGSSRRRSSPSPASSSAAAQSSTRELGMLDAAIARGDRGGRRRDHRAASTTSTELPGRHLPDRLGHLVEHEHERGARDPRHDEARRARAPERPRQRLAVVERRVPDLGARRRDRRAHRRPRPGARPPRGRARGEGRAVGGRREVGSHPPHGCHAGHPRPGVRRLRPPGAARHRARAGRAPPRRRGSARRHRGRHGHQHPGGLPAAGHRARSAETGAADHRGRRPLRGAGARATASSTPPARCAPSR